MFKKILSLVFLFAMNLISAVSVAEQIIGKAIAMEGDVKIIRGGKSLPQLSAGDDIFLEDIVSTGARSGARILLTDHTILDIKEKSNFSVKSFSGSGIERQAEFDLDFGSVRASVNQKLKNKNQYQIKSKAAVFAVRGTDFFIEATDENKPLQVTVFEGVVAAKLANNENEVINGETLKLANNNLSNVKLSQSDLDYIYKESRNEDLTFLQNIVIGDVAESRNQGASTVRVLNMMSHEPVVQLPAGKLKNATYFLPNADVVSPASLNFIPFTVEASVPY